MSEAGAAHTERNQSDALESEMGKEESRQRHHKSARDRDPALALVAIHDADAAQNDPVGLERDDLLPLRVLLVARVLYLDSNRFEAVLRGLDVEYLFRLAPVTGAVMQIGNPFALQADMPPRRAPMYLILAVFMLQ